MAITTSNSINVKPRLKSLTLEGDIFITFSLVWRYSTTLTFFLLPRFECYLGHMAGKMRKPWKRCKDKQKPRKIWGFRGLKLVAGARFELTTFRLWAWRATGLLHPASKKCCSWKAWQRLTLPHLKMQYHQRYRISLPSSGWGRVVHLCHNHQVV